MVNQVLKLTEEWQKEEELLVLGFFEKEGKPFGSDLGNTIFANLSAGLSNLQQDFQGKFGQKSLIYKIIPKRILFVGLGPEEKFDFEKQKEIAGEVACYIRDQKIKSFSTEVFGYQDTDSPKIKAMRVKAQIEGQALGLYRFDSYKKFDARIEKIKVLVNFLSPEIERVFEQTTILIENLYFIRHLINTPSNHLTPKLLAEIAHTQSLRSQGKFQCQIFDQRELELLGMNLILAVGRGSENSPCLIILEYKPQNAQNEKPYVLVGKGVCFDSGGLNLKPEGAMANMHTDMAGGAVVFGTIKTAAELNLPLWIIGLVPAVENLISGKSYKPGDIIRAYNHKTVEIVNTDAEGRLILFDALAFAKEKFSPKLIIDIATLTGACQVALGEEYAGLMGNSPEFLEKIKKAGQESGDKVWELPLDEKYLKELKSEVADLKNCGSRWAGAIKAACFLQEAVDRDQPWLHLDIAGAARMDVVGQATGFGLRLFLQFLINELTMN